MLVSNVPFAGAKGMRTDEFFQRQLLDVRICPVNKNQSVIVEKNFVDTDSYGFMLEFVQCRKTWSKISQPCFAIYALALERFFQTSFTNRTAP